MERDLEWLLGSIISRTQIDRAVISKVHNGGGKIIIGAEKKVSVIVEPENSLAPHTKEAYQSVPIDRQYKKVIIDLIEGPDHAYLFHREEALPPGLFKVKVNADNIKGVFHFNLHISDEGIYYAFIATTGDPDYILSDKRQMGLIQEHIGLIRKKIKQSQKLLR